MTLAQVVYRIVKDSAFATQLQREPQLALAATDLKLDNKDLAALLTIVHDKALWQGLCAPSIDELQILQGWV